MKIVQFVLALVIVFAVIFIFSSCRHDEKFNLSESNNKFKLVSSDGLNLSYIYDKFYLTNEPGYLFDSSVGSVVSNELDKPNGLYRLLNTTGSMDLVLDYNQTNPSDSRVNQVDKQITQSNDVFNIFTQNTSTNTLKNIFSMQDNNIYLDPINKVIISTDTQGNTIYLSKVLINEPVTWNYNIFNAVTFDLVNY
jgi:hypothetical protein